MKVMFVAKNKKMLYQKLIPFNPTIRECNDLIAKGYKMVILDEGAQEDRRAYNDR